MSISKTYAFEDVAATFSHPSVGQLQLQGEGLGSVTISMSADVTAHDLAADGTVMPSKIKVPNGTITISVQQTSSAQEYFRRYFNYVKAAPPAEWALATFMMTAQYMGVSYTCTGISPQKRPDASYEQSGKQVAWAFMAANIEEV